jgi:hypothetical protein
LVLSLSTVTSCQTVPVAPEAASARLSAEQCYFFQEGGSVTICHATSSTKNPMVKIRVATAGCVEGHTKHPNDRIAVDANDNCGPGACLAADAPCDATLPCCGGACTNGVCPPADLCVSGNVTCSPEDDCHVAGTCDPQTGLCSNPTTADGTACSGGVCSGGQCVDLCAANHVTCNAQDQCHLAGACDPQTGLCSYPAAPDGTACSNGNACTHADSCQGGACAAGPPTLSITSVSLPTPADPTLTIHGSGFTGATQVTFGSAVVAFTVVDDSLITATIAQFAQSAAVTVSSSCGTANAGACAGSDERFPAPVDGQATFTCPTTSAVNGIIIPDTCDFPRSWDTYGFAYNGPVVLESHLERWFADYDVGHNVIGRFDLSCLYFDPFGNPVGFLARYIKLTGCCTADATSFTCCAGGPCPGINSSGPNTLCNF